MAKKSEEKKPKLVPSYTQKYEYRVYDYPKPYKNYGGKEKVINELAKQGWELVCTSVMIMGITDDIRVDKKTGEETRLGKKVWCIEHLYFRREMIKEMRKEKPNAT